MSVADKTWRERIAEAEARGQFTEEDEGLALHFSTCAVGEQVTRGLIPNYYCDMIADIQERLAELREPMPTTLYGLGGQFYSAVRSRQFARCHTLLDAIEDRALQLKREGLDAAR